MSRVIYSIKGRSLKIHQWNSDFKVGVEPIRLSVFALHFDANWVIKEKEERGKAHLFFQKMKYRRPTEIISYSIKPH